jgi:acyl-CoA synthetase (AMP-forming)/AMP-acid ligase II
VNIAMVLDLVADTLGDRVALSDAGEELTYGDLRRLARATAAQLRTLGASTLAYADVNSPGVPTALFGAAWAGAAYAPLNFRLPAEALRAQIARLDHPLTVTSGALAAQLTEVRPQPAHDWLDALRRSPDAPATTYDAEPERPAVVLFTSGSSGTPKAALLSHDNLLSYILETVEFAGAGPDEALILAAPPFHIAGVAAVLTSVYSGRRIILLPAFTAGAWLELARSQGATHAFLVPTMLARIVQEMASDPDLGVPTLRSISYGGARMAAPVLEWALELFPEVSFVNAYGLTETSSTIALLGPEDHRLALASDEPRVRRRLESVGRPLPGVEVSVLDESGSEAPTGTTGTIRVRGPQVGGTYLDTASSLDEGGWLTTGDVGHLDPDGFLFVEGRADDVIIKGGENLSPAEIEDTLLRHPAVLAAAVVAVPDPEWGESVGAAVVVAGPGEDLREDLLAWVRGALGSLKTPTRLEFVDELPTTATGKILRREVRRSLASPAPP